MVIFFISRDAIYSTIYFFPNKAVCFNCSKNYDEILII